MDPETLIALAGMFGGGGGGGSSLSNLANTVFGGGGGGQGGGPGDFMSTMLGGGDPWSALYGSDAGPMQAQASLSGGPDTSQQPDQTGVQQPQQQQAQAQPPQDQANQAASQAVRNIQGDMAPPASFDVTQPVNKTAGPVGFTKDQSQAPQNPSVVDPNAVLKNAMQGYTGGGPYNIGSVPSANRLPPQQQNTFTDLTQPNPVPMPQPRPAEANAGPVPLPQPRPMGADAASVDTPESPYNRSIGPTVDPKYADPNTYLTKPNAINVGKAAGATTPPAPTPPPSAVPRDPTRVGGGAPVPDFIQNILNQLGNPQSLPQLIGAAMRLFGQGGFPGPGQGTPLGMIPWTPGYGPGTRGGYGTMGRGQPSWWTDRDRGWRRSRDGGWERRDPRTGQVVETVSPRQGTSAARPAAKATDRKAAPKKTKAARTNLDRIRNTYAMADEPLVPPENFQLRGDKEAEPTTKRQENEADRFIRDIIEQGKRPDLPWGRGGTSPYPAKIWPNWPDIPEGDPRFQRLPTVPGQPLDPVNKTPLRYLV